MGRRRQGQPRKTCMAMGHHVASMILKRLSSPEVAFDSSPSPWRPPQRQKASIINHFPYSPSASAVMHVYEEAERLPPLQSQCHHEAAAVQSSAIALPSAQEACSGGFVDSSTYFQQPYKRRPTPQSPSSGKIPTHRQESYHHTVANSQVLKPQASNFTLCLYCILLCHQHKHQASSITQETSTLTFIRQCIFNLFPRS